MQERRAVIDIGTNSVKLLVGKISGRVIRPLLSAREVTRLGQGVNKTHWLQPDAIARTAQAVARFACQVSDFHPCPIKIFATSAARRAGNRADLVTAVQEACQLSVEIISGEQEAFWAFEGINSDPALAGSPLMMFDLGGGSTEFVVGRSVAFAVHSFPIGSLGLLEQLELSDPPTPGDLANCRAWVADMLHWEVVPKMKAAIKAFGPQRLILAGTGGNVAALAQVAAGSEAIRPGFALTLDQVRHSTKRLWRLSLDQRRQIPELPSPRADVILTAVVIIEGIMERLGFPQLQFSERGVRYGALLAAFRQYSVSAAPSIQAGMRIESVARAPARPAAA